MFCKYCGTSNPDGAMVCSACGKSLTAVAAPAAPFAPSQPMNPPMSANNQPVYPGAPAGNQPAYPGMPVGNQPAYPGMPVGNQPAYPGMPVGNQPAYPGMPVNNQNVYPGMPAGNQPGYPGMPMGANPYAGAAVKPRGKRKINFIAMAAAIILGISTFLPFASAKAFGLSQSINLFQGGDAVFFIIVAVLALIFAIPGLDIGVIIMGAISVILFFIENSAFSSAMSFVKRDIGFYALLVGSLLMVAAGIIGIVQRQKRQ